MTAFVVKKGTLGTVVHNLGNGNFDRFQHITKKDNMFFREDIVIDPLRNLDDDSDNNAGAVIAAFVSPRDVYGFCRMNLQTGKREPWTLLVPVGSVEVD